MKKVTLLVASLFCLCACSAHLKSAVKDGKIAPSFTDTLTDENYLWVRGFGAANPKHTSDSQRRILSREAAIANAYQRAMEVLYGTNLESNIEIVDAVSESTNLHTSANGVLSHMELVSTEYLEDGGCSVVMRVARKYVQEVQPNTKE